MNERNDTILKLTRAVEQFREDVKKLETDLSWEKQKRLDAEEERDDAIKKVQDLEALRAFSVRKRS